MAKTYSRRRAIAIFAAAAGLPLLTGATASASAVTWTGQALGAPATLILNHEDEAKAVRLIERVVAEVSRLEAVFSLYREDSALSELNRARVLVAPPRDLVSVLQACRTFWQLTDGAFDPTVQPLWALYRDHFSTAGADPAGPSSAELRHTLTKVSFEAVKFNHDIVVMRPNMALTLNGIAQGYITDRVVDMLRDAGVTSSLVDMGEDRAIGGRADGTPWRIGLADREDASQPDLVLNVFNKAVATSSVAGFHFDDAGRFGHILDPRTGGAASLYRRVSVVEDNAAAADALSTAFSIMDKPGIVRLVQSRPGLSVDIVDGAGVRARMGAPV